MSRAEWGMRVLISSAAFVFRKLGRKSKTLRNKEVNFDVCGLFVFFKYRDLMKRDASPYG